MLTSYSSPGLAGLNHHAFDERPERSHKRISGVPNRHFPPLCGSVQAKDEGINTIDFFVFNHVQFLTSVAGTVYTSKAAV
jgi:hypothetical protein